MNPWGSNIRDLCAGPDLPPVAYRSDGERLAALLTKLLPSYLALRESLQLKDALWSYWVAGEAPASYDLPTYAAAIEILKNNWLASTESKSRGVHMTKGEFDELSGDLVSELARRIQERGLSDELLKNFAGANRMGLGEKMSVFFREIDIHTGPYEKRAINARHKAAHGASGEELMQLVRYGNTYRTLFNRVLLRLLGHEGDYVDRASEGHLDRPLIQPAGGA